MLARRFLRWSLIALLFVQTACGGLLAGAGVGLPGWDARTSAASFSAGFNLFSPEQDVELGKLSAEEMKQQVHVLRDERTSAYVQRLGEKIASRAGGYDFAYKFVVVSSPEVNAFALPGGYVFVNTGAIEAARSEGELAGVLAHEIAHVSLRHATSQASKTYLTKTGLSLLDAVTGGKESTAGQIVAALGCAGANALFLRSNRTAEIQADLEGARLMAAAGYDPRDMAGFFETLSERGESKPETHNDHPDSALRVAAVEEVIPTLQIADSPLHDTEEFRRIKSRLKGAR